MEYRKKTVIILGAGPVGLFSAFKILENNFAENVLVLEKRMDPKWENDEWASRSMVVQFHRRFFSFSIPDALIHCPNGVFSEDNEENRRKYSDLDHMSLSSIQSILLKEINDNYNDRFSLMKIEDILCEDDVISLVVDCNGEQHFSVLNPSLLVDATGYHSTLMNKIIGVEFEDEFEYGSALKITWPEHNLSHAEDKLIEFHDCHKNTKFFSYGYSSVAEFSYPSEDFNVFFEDCGYSINNQSIKIPFLKDDTTPFSIKLPAFLKRIVSLDKNDDLYKKSISLFRKIREGKLNGINGYEFIKHLQDFCWHEADTLSLVIRQILRKNITIKDVYVDIDSDHADLEKIGIVFVPSRAERWLSTNRVKTNIKLVSVNGSYEISGFNLIHPVTACAVGDSLASTDFRHGLGINRGFHTAVRLFQNKIDPESARRELIENGYFILNEFSDHNIFSRAISCRDWLISH
ncbi:hypothetical protein EH228_11560 [Erwinia endophytica]|uniref:hypothetical protein n=1 Tax=Erwinia endophytica TaxID=1563158 RepID=UPI001265E605|nr:hypothetical protein [Erwinia endophytica]KAB8310136.1 hypothetical protein EH228_11560 [Erwinia endophytica]